MDPRENVLFSRLYSELNPEIFSHPIWRDFLERKELVPKSLVKDLLIESENLERIGNWIEYCQILMLCAYLDHLLKEDLNAKLLLQKVRNLAVEQNLTQLARYADWGLCSINIHFGKKENIIESLDRLSMNFLTTGDWVISEMIELIKLGFQEDVGEFEPVRTAMQWMKHWGEYRLDRSTPKREKRIPQKRSSLLDGIGSWEKRINLFFSFATRFGSSTIKRG